METLKNYLIKCNLNHELEKGFIVSRCNLVGGCNVNYYIEKPEIVKDLLNLKDEKVITKTKGNNGIPIIYTVFSPIDEL